MKILRFVAAFCAASLSMASTALADSLITEFNNANVRQALEEIGATGVEFSTSRNDNAPLVRFSADGRNYIFVYRACREGTCRALNMTIEFAPGPQPYPLSLANGFNEYRAAATAVVHANGVLKLNRYLVATAGITQANFLANLRLFLTMPDQLRTYMQQTPVASLPGPAVPAAGAVVPMAARSPETTANENASYAVIGRANKLQ